jgi:fructan beta-fructosidase
VAIFTQHNEVGERSGRNNFQNQSIAYSNDNGKTWIKYSGNPVLHNPGIRDFRDPKVSWYGPGKKWIMTLAAGDHISFYSSPDLKTWKKESDFGAGIGAHGGVWECPDLFSIDNKGQPVWVMIVNLNPGAPNGGSGTQYFVGNFDGHSFVPFENTTKWLDYGPDDYAGITWTNTGKRKIFLGWMSNWMYADKVPTTTWRSATTIPRDLKLVRKNDNWFLSSLPVPELLAGVKPARILSNVSVNGSLDITSRLAGFTVPALLQVNIDTLDDFSIQFSNTQGERVLVGYDRKMNEFFIDRSQSGTTAFHDRFAARHVAPRLASGSKSEVAILIDRASVELFADGGLTVMTAICFPTSGFDHVSLNAPASRVIKKLVYYRFAQ